MCKLEGCYCQEVNFDLELRWFLEREMIVLFWKLKVGQELVTWNKIVICSLDKVQVINDNY